MLQMHHDVVAPPQCSGSHPDQGLVRQNLEVYRFPGEDGVRLEQLEGVDRESLPAPRADDCDERAHRSSGDRRVEVGVTAHLDHVAAVHTKRCE